MMRIICIDRKIALLTRKRCDRDTAYVIKTPMDTSEYVDVTTIELY
jgi:hypothetical protein